MTKDEKELFNEKIKGLYAAISANADIQHERDNVILEKLDRIEQQTTKTNGRVTILEDKELKHIIECPVQKQVDEMKEDLFEYRIFKKYPKIAAGVMIIVGLSAVAVILGQFGII